jgi:hypothetical protein
MLAHEKFATAIFVAQVIGPNARVALYSSNPPILVSCMEETRSKSSFTKCMQRRFYWRALLPESTAAPRGSSNSGSGRAEELVRGYAHIRAHTPFAKVFWPSARTLSLWR